jgi:hypothetical protein
MVCRSYAGLTLLPLSLLPLLVLLLLVLLPLVLLLLTATAVATIMHYNAHTDEWTAYTIDLPTPYETLYFQIRHSTLTGSGFKIIVDSTNCKDPTLDGGAVVLEVAETIAAYIPGPGLTPPKSYGFLPKCWHTERWLTLPIKTPGEHVLVFCSISDDFNLQVRS